LSSTNLYLWMKSSSFGRINSSESATLQNLLKLVVLWTCVVKE
jgi:hypothetical protein